MNHYPQANFNDRFFGLVIPVQLIMTYALCNLEQLKPDILTHYLSILQTVVALNAGTLSMEFGLHASTEYDCVCE